MNLPYIKAWDFTNDVYQNNYDAGKYSDNNKWVSLPQNLLKSEYQSSGYYGRAYVNIETHQVIISNRGSENLFNPKHLWQDWIKADGNIAMGKPSDQFEHAFNFSKDVHNYISKEYTNTNFNYTHTGHSLGAGLGHVTAARFKEESIGYDSPGVKNIINFYNADVKYASEHSLSIQSINNIVNDTGEHHENVLRIQDKDSYIFNDKFNPDTDSHTDDGASNFADNFLRQSTHIRDYIDKHLQNGFPTNHKVESLYVPSSSSNTKSAANQTSFKDLSFSFAEILHSIENNIQKLLANTH